MNKYGGYCALGIVIKYWTTWRRWRMRTWQVRDNRVMRSAKVRFI